ncbi:protein of unknown function [Brevefilum fermentans]|uniref:Uncharacterized protein n=1 Tax=Candidatus Brevifilum fermentans TaxID=1986204 RepID=A0A1Y6K6I3_9CHLR|nr:protein of unknown function [Brevefilum fermentans]
MLHCVRNDNTFLLSSRACEAISSFTPLRLLHYVRNDNNAEIHLYPCHREPPTPVIASLRSDLISHTPEIASLRSQ